MAYMQRDTVGTLRKMDKGISGPEAPDTQATSGGCKGYRDHCLCTSMTQSNSVHGSGSSNRR